MWDNFSDQIGTGESNIAKLLAGDSYSGSEDGLLVAMLTVLLLANNCYACKV